jgi:ketosteroid isomerase-like protein
MKKLGLIAALFALAVPALGQVDAKLEKEMRASYNRVIAAMKKKDVKGVMAEMTSDATMTEMGRKMSRAEMEAMLKQQMPAMDVQSATIKFSKLTAKGNTANAEYTETMKVKVPGPSGKPGLMESVAKYRGAFKKVGGVWKMHSSELIGTPKMKMNGKPFNPMGAPPK